MLYYFIVERARDVIVKSPAMRSARYRMVVSSPFKAVLATTAEERPVLAEGVVAIEDPKTGL